MATRVVRLVCASLSCGAQSHAGTCWAARAGLIWSKHRHAGCWCDGGKPPSSGWTCFIFTVHLRVQCQSWSHLNTRLHELAEDLLSNMRPRICLTLMLWSQEPVRSTRSCSGPPTAVVKHLPWLGMVVEAPDASLDLKNEAMVDVWVSV